MKRLIKKFFETPREERVKRILDYTKAKATKGAWPLYMSFLRLILHRDFYVQRRPYYDLGGHNCPRIAEFEEFWDKRRPFEKDNARLYFLYYDN